MRGYLYLYVCVMKVVKIGSNYYRECDEDRVSIADNIIEVRENKIDIPTRNFWQEIVLMWVTVGCAIGLMLAMVSIFRSAINC